MFSSRNMNYGRNYFRRGSVCITSCGATSLQARVFGTRVYIVTLELSGDEVYANCTCPAFDGEQCKHVYATILAANTDGWPGNAPDASWKSAISDIRSGFRTPQRSIARVPRPEECRTVFQINGLGHGAYSYHTEDIEMELLEQRRRRDGQWDRAKRATEGISALLESSRVEEQVIGQMLVGADEYHHSISSRKFYIRPASQRVLIGQLCRMGIVSMRSEEKQKTWQPLAWDDRRWEFFLTNQNGEDGRQEIIGGFRCGEETLTLTDIAFIAPGGLLVTRNFVAEVECFDSHSLLDYLQKRRRIVVDPKAARAFLAELMKLPRVPKLEFTDAFSIVETSLDPHPGMFVRKPDHQLHSANVLLAEVKFDYDGRIIASDDGAPGIFDPQSSTLVRRNHELERKYLEHAMRLGFRQYSQGTYGMLLSINRDQLPHAVGALLSEGWHVEAAGALYRRPGEFKLSVNSGIDWFELNGTVDYDGISVPLPRLLQAMRKGEATVELGDGQIGVLPTDWLAKYAPLAGLGESEGDSLRFSNAQVGFLDALLAQMPEITCDETFTQARKKLRTFEGIRSMSAPDQFTGTLREYQCDGLGWLNFLQDFRFGGCLADDMGLGKTIQVLALLEQRRKSESGVSLAVVPRSLIFNWTQEALKFTPNLRVLDHSHAARKRQGDHFKDYDLILTTYGTLRRDAGYFKDIEFDYVILDEAQAIKNPGTDSAKAARLLRARHRLALTGTPVENRLSELWSIFDFLNPGMLGGASVFKSLIGDGADAESRKLLASALRPFILRRTKSQVARDLPEKTEQTLFCELPPKQRKAYDELRDYYRAALLSKIDTDGINRSQIMILESLLRLRQAACHPGLIDRKSDDLPSAKLDMLFEQLEDLLAEGHKALIFSQFTSFLALVSKRLKEKGVTFEYLDGKTRDRQARVDRFQTDANCPLFLISLKAGGVGLNLTAADYVFLLDPWWNPAVESQAIDRTHRIGQTRNVFAYRIIAKDTVEEKVLQLQKSKRDLADAIVNEDNSSISKLTREDIAMLLS